MLVEGHITVGTWRAAGVRLPGTSLLHAERLATPGRRDTRPDERNFVWNLEPYVLSLSSSKGLMLCLVCLIHHDDADHVTA